MNRPLRIACLSLCGLLLLAQPLGAVTMDWDTQTWTNAANGTPLPNSYDIDPAHPGNDLTITATGNNGATFTTDIGTGNPQTPAVAAFFQGGLATTQNSLVLALDLANNTQSVTINLAFAAAYPAGVSNLTFTLFDIDYRNGGGSTYQDMLTNIRGLDVNGNWVAPTITTSASNTLTGTGLAQVVTGTASVNDTGAGSGDGNVTISFGGVAITAFQFTYGSSGLFANPTFQHVGLWDFSFTPVPELDPAWAAGLFCLAAAGTALRRRARAQ